MLKNYILLLIHVQVILGGKDEPKKLLDYFRQDEYKLYFERVELNRYNKQFYNSFKVVTYKYNRTSPVVNLTFSYSVETGNKIEVITQAYKFLSNEYRLFPLHFQVNFCAAMKENIVGLDRLTMCGNATQCYYLKNHLYHVCNWSPEQYKFPPGIPTGRYMVELQFMYYSSELFVLHCYGEIARPPPITE